VFYADDCSLHHSSKDVTTINEKINEDLVHITKWCKINGMKINTEKTKAMLFHPSNLKPNTDMKINIDNNNIEIVTEFKYLGLILQNKLANDLHYNKVCKEMNTRIFMINRYKHSFSSKWLRIFGTSLVLSIMDYCLPVWGNLLKTKYDRLDKIMLRLVNLVIVKTKLEKYDAFEKMNWLSSEERFSVYSLEYVFKNVISKTAIPNLHQQFCKKEQSERESKTSNNLKAEMKTEFGKKSFFYTITKMWNKLPTNIKSIQNFSEFDSTLRKHYLKLRQNDYQFY
jgi:hypothetical protein